jgi:predicted nucleic acid-binding protein
MLAAQSLLHHAALVTRDAAFGDLRGLPIIW